MTGAAPGGWTRRSTLSPGRRRLALLLVSGFLVHAILGYTADLPSWRMFVTAYRYDYTLWDRHDRPVDLREWIGPENYLTQPTLVPLVARWVARTHPDRAPLRGEVTIYRPHGAERYRLLAHPGGKLEWARIARDPTGKPSSSNKGSPSSSG